VVAWLVHLSPDRAVQVQALAGAVFKPCVAFLVKTLYSRRASFHPSVEMGTGEFNAGGNTEMDLHPIQGRVEIPLVA